MSIAYPEPLSSSGPARTRIVRWALVLGGLAGAVAVTLLFLQRPEGQLFYPRCTFYSLTGLLCPGCGGLRSAHELLHGHVLSAARCNALFVVGAPAALAWWGWRRWQGRPTEVTPRVVWWLFAVLMVFTLVRNLPGWPSAWLAP